MRLIFQPHMTDLVRVFRYDTLSQDEAKTRTEPLIEKHGREKLADAAADGAGHHPTADSSPYSRADGAGHHPAADSSPYSRADSSPDSPRDDHYRGDDHHDSTRDDHHYHDDST